MSTPGSPGHPKHPLATLQTYYEQSKSESGLRTGGAHPSAGGHQSDDQYSINVRSLVRLVFVYVASVVRTGIPQIPVRALGRISSVHKYFIDLVSKIPPKWRGGSIFEV